MGLKAFGGGTHQSKTMMLPDLREVLNLNGIPARTAVIEENILGNTKAR